MVADVGYIRVEQIEGLLQTTSGVKAVVGSYRVQLMIGMVCGRWKVVKMGGR